MPFRASEALRMFGFFPDFMKRPVSFVHTMPCLWWEGFKAHLVLLHSL